MRTVNRLLLASGGAAVVSLAPAIADAQLDIHPRLPNVLLLIANAGSMEYLIEPDPNTTTNPKGIYLMTGESPDASPGAACTGVAGQTTELNRWSTVATVLTGTIPLGSYSCVAQDRSSAQFVSEYAYNDGTNTTNPYDYRYFLPFHRIYSNGCTVGAGVMDGPSQSNFWTEPAVQFQYHDVNGKPCVWSGQAADGLLDAFSGLIRFGLMTYDTFPDPNTGILNTAVSSPLAEKGQWSYFNGWSTAQNFTYPPATTGAPMSGPNTGPAAGFTVPSSNPIGKVYMEVGARNPAAPPWEGQLVPFGNPYDDSNVPATNATIQNEILALRPYGASPLAGMLDDAEYFLYQDTTALPSTNQYQLGPANDPYWQGGCRKTYIVVITDGEPNMDLQTSDPNNPNLPLCSPTVPGSCPYRTPEQIVNEMYYWNPSAQAVQTFVIGFASSTPPAIAAPGNPSYNPSASNPPPPGNPTTCNLFPPNGSGQTAISLTNDCTPAVLAQYPSLAPCCTLNQIAMAGSGQQLGAFFADNAIALKQTLSNLLSGLLVNTTARTYPVYTPAGNQAAQSKQLPFPIAEYEFSSSFNVTAAPTGNNASPSGMWTGNLVRERTSCQGGLPTQQLVSPGLGDDYAANLNMPNPLNPPGFFTAIGAPVNGNPNIIDSDYTIRPFIPADDGFGTYGLTSMAPTGPTLQNPATFPGAMSAYPAAFGISDNQAVCNNAFGFQGPGSSVPCTNAIVNWEVGGNNPAQGGTQTLPTFTRDPTQCTIAGQICSKLGAIYHSTPAVVGAPNEFLTDDTYTAYSLANATEPIMLYTATMDGQLHAFQVASNDPTQVNNATDGELQNNEIWSFMPPRVLQHILPNYNIPGVALLDGAPVVADVPGQPYNVGVTNPVLYRVDTPGSPVQWHRVLLASGGDGGGYYYALDVTNPAQPEFLWQLSTDSQGYPMFGLTTPTPTIAVVAITQNGVLTQVPVAIMPGGSGITTGCPAAGPPLSQFGAQTIVNGVPISIAAANDPAGLNQNNPAGSLNHLPSTPQPLNCWDNSVNNTRASGNSLTIARLDTGQVLAHFIGSSALGGNDYSGAPGPGGGSVAANNNKINNGFNNVFAAPFAAPLVGVPVAYPNLTGQVSDRVYVGDADGLLWRIDLSSPNPANWYAQIAWDAYVLNGDAGLREPAELAPVVSQDPLGDVVVLYATGDQDTFTAQNSSIRVWSLTETPAAVSGTTAYNMSQNWWMAFASNGGNNNAANCSANLAGPASEPPSQCNRRVTGPMTLFNSTLYFSTFTPQSTSVCSPGFASLWAVDYVRPDPNNLPLPLAQFPSGGPANALYQDAQPGSIIEGASVSQTVSCDAQNGTMVGDPYFGTHNVVSNVTQATFQLNWNAGAGSGIAGGQVHNDANNSYNINGTNSSASRIGTQQSMQIAGPGQATKIDSWGAVIGQ